MSAKQKKILDATSGSRMMWFDKTNSETLFADNRIENHILCDGRTLEINPDVKIDFRKMPFDDNTFYLIVFDPPHLIRLGTKSWMAKKYGVLKSTWQEDIRKGFRECMRVLKPNGTLIFKWSEHQVTLGQVLKAIGERPLFGHTSAKPGKTIWMTFMKIEQSA